MNCELYRWKLLLLVLLSSHLGAHLPLMTLWLIRWMASHPNFVDQINVSNVCLACPRYCHYLCIDTSRLSEMIGFSKWCSTSYWIANQRQIWIPILDCSGHWTLESSSRFNHIEGALFCDSTLCSWVQWRCAVWCPRDRAAWMHRSRFQMSLGYVGCGAGKH